MKEEREPIIEVRNASFSYMINGSIQRVFESLSLSLLSGEFLSILGPSGCGKSTLLRALSGRIELLSGQILYSGQPIQHSSTEIVHLSQDDALFPWKNVESQIAFGLEVRRESSTDIKETVERLLVATGITDARKKFPHELSGGMRKRVAIARALAVKPKVLLLDEPFSALDVGTRRQIQRVMEDIWRVSGTTIVLVTHDIEEAISMSERVLVLDGTPCRIVKELDMRLEANEDRMSKTFLQRRRYLESLFYGERP